MKIIKNILELKENLQNTYVAIGTFDGVHYGHQKLITEAVKKAKENNGTSVVFTFSSHPLELIDKNKAPKSINTIDEKLYLLEKLGVDCVILQPFNKEFANLTAEQFADILKEKVGSKEIFVGFNFSFGEGGKSNTHDLIRLGKERGILVHEIPAVYIDDKLISSTFTRSQIPDGDIELINKYLGHNFVIMGEVVHGKKLASEVLGFPTANIQMAERIYPKTGIYGAKVKIEGENFYRDGVVNIGVNPTLKPGEKSVEVNIFDFDQFIYGKKIVVELVKYLREEKKFSSIESLKAQIAEDVEQWKKIISECDNGNSSKNR
ncbi:bifunctional riboflavin kinase/FAD synthetase [Fusobacterium hominis]|uniref:Riboflavin biosynthesis protein n=1 Tax=Fusobacterium hominis TaxID=2764326 RepID=A0A7G9GYA5_9FUSO|nr:bifunctional riboflavin kinase/FAD synthetase [Fusobacterium hominis]QNM15787.1 bifunctional riboflavin kinase/FAD synthetase [Fusobacterium hominis]